jgi:hypothetical protein
MIETVQTNDVLDEQEFGYYARMEGYANLSSDMKGLNGTCLNDFADHNT